ncbi:hypothetical protein NKG05_06570 [Oerskovia sp. M15]
MDHRAVPQVEQVLGGEPGAEALVHGDRQDARGPGGRRHGIPAAGTGAASPAHGRR